MRSLLLLLLVLPLMAGDALGQLPSWLRPGARLRVTGATSPPLVGVLVRSSPDSVAIIADHTADTIRVALAVANRIEVSRERRSRAGRGARIGLLTGSGLVMLVIGTSNDQKPPDALGTMVLCGLFGGLGAGLGGLIGSGVATDVWEPIAHESARFQITPSRRGVSIGLSFKL